MASLRHRQGQQHQHRKQCAACRAAQQLQSHGFAIEPEIAARLVQKGERIYEVPIHYRARSSDEGKKLTAYDGFRVLATLLRCRFS